MTDKIGWRSISESLGTTMIWLITTHILTLLLELIYLSRKSSHEKDLEILLLRRQIVILQRCQHKVIRPARWDKLILAVLTVRLKDQTERTVNKLRETIRIVQPETVLRWHREIVKRKWRQTSHQSGGRPRTSKEIETPVLRLARENRWR